MKIHFIGIKGIGMSALAQFFLSKGWKVSGSDTADVFPLDDKLKELSIPIKKFSKKNIVKDLDKVVYSSAYNEDHPERKEASKLNLPLMSYGKALAEIFNSYKNRVLVAGTHGKTTTTAMTAEILIRAGFNPTAIVGGKVLNWNNNFYYDKGEWIIAEGDEYQEKFLELRPTHLIITNIDYDHPDFFKTKKSYREAFLKLIKNVKNENIVASYPKKNVFNLRLSILGDYNILNANAAFCLTQKIGVKEEIIKSALANFRGVSRRLELYTKSDNNIIVIDDYAHQPTAVKAAISSVRSAYPDYKIAVFFQSHTFSRTQTMADDFAKSLSLSDKIFLFNIYGSAREKMTRKEMSQISRRFFKTVKHCGKPAVFCSSFKDGLKNWKHFLEKNKNGKIVAITMGAGDIWKLARQLV